MSVIIPEEPLAGNSWYMLKFSVDIATLLNPAIWSTNVDKPLIEITSLVLKVWKGSTLTVILLLFQSKAQFVNSETEDAIEVTVAPSTWEMIALAPPPLVPSLSKLITSSTL